MPANSYWLTQLKEKMKEAARLHSRFTLAAEPNVDDLDAAIEIFEKCRAAYFKHYTFEVFIFFGESLRAKQAFNAFN